MAHGCSCHFQNDLLSYLDEAFRQQNESLNTFLAETLRQELCRQPAALASAAVSLAPANGGDGGCIRAAPPLAQRNGFGSCPWQPEALPQVRVASAASGSSAVERTLDSAVQPMASVLGPVEGSTHFTLTMSDTSDSEPSLERLSEGRPKNLGESMNSGAFVSRRSSAHPETPQTRPGQVTRFNKEDGPLIRMRAAVQSVTETQGFDNCVLLIVALYTVSLGMQAEYSTMPDNKRVNDVFFWLEVCFCTLFSLEIGAKIFVEGRQFFVGLHSAWNICTFGLVLLQLLELVLISMSRNFLELNANIVMLRVLRSLRLTRVARSLRVVNILRDIRNIVVSIIGSVRHVGWTLMLMIFIAFVIGISITLMVGDAYERCDGELPTNDGQACPKEIQMHFGSMGASTFTLFAAVSGGIDWHGAALQLKNEVSVVACALVLLYVAFVVFALFNAVTGAFVDSRLRFSEMAQTELLRTTAQRALQKAAGESVERDTEEHQIRIDRAAFIEAMKGHEMQTVFSDMDIDISEPEKIFDLLDVDRNGTIEVKDFYESIHQMSGPAKALDFARFQNQWQNAHSKHSGEIADLRQIIDTLCSTLNSGGTGLRCGRTVMRAVETSKNTTL